LHRYPHARKVTVLPSMESSSAGARPDRRWTGLTPVYPPTSDLLAGSYWRSARGRSPPDQTHLDRAVWSEALLTSWPPPFDGSPQVSSKPGADDRPLLDGSSAMRSQRRRERHGTSGWAPVDPLAMLRAFAKPITDVHRALQRPLPIPADAASLRLQSLDFR
jgi:hypothetical protein